MKPRYKRREIRVLSWLKTLLSRIELKQCIYWDLVPSYCWNGPPNKGKVREYDLSKVLIILDTGLGRLLHNDPTTLSPTNGYVDDSIVCANSLKQCRNLKLLTVHKQGLLAEKLIG